ncbi:hypothetical protein ACFSCV_05455 [Methylopila henanensis]|uniref:MxaK protein n=1 Tax=Methylopila henanensis TaxID=873516 RepID=A0ABW4K2Q8_9HYPH
MRLGALRSLLPPALALAALVALGYAGWRLYEQRQERAYIQALAANRDVQPADDATAAALFARAHYLLARDRIDEAQGLVGRITERGSPAVVARFHYDVGNARTRRAIAAIEATKIDVAIPEVRLAKESYREALRADPELWDARFNLDVVMRLVRDFPEVERGEEETKAQPKKLWTDLPGLPRGLP